MTGRTAPVVDLTRVEVAPMTEADLDGVVAIEEAVHARPWSRKLFADELDRRGRCYLVARSGDEIVGYAGLLMIADDGHVSTVSVDPDRQGRGIATRLLVELVRGALALDASQLTLEVRASNRRAQRLYGRFGFVPAGARKGYYGDNGEDAIVMWVHEVAGDAYAGRLRAIEATFPTATVRRDVSSPGAGPTASHPAASRSESATGPGRMER